MNYTRQIIFMKRILLLNACLFGILLRATAQQEGDIYFEPAVGFDTRWIVNQDIYGNAEMDYVTSYGMFYGFHGSFFLKQDFGLNAGIGFRKMGQKYDGMQQGAFARRNVTLNYIQVPVMAMFALSGHDYPTWFSIGPQFCVLANATQYFHREDGGTPLTRPDYLPEGEINVTKWYKPFDIMIAMEFNRVMALRKLPKLSLNYVLETGYGVFDINRKEYQIPNIHGVYKGSHNMYLGFRFGVMYNAIR